MADNAPIDRAHATPGGILTIGGLALAVAGALQLLVAVQFLSWWDLPLLADVTLYGQLAMGLVAIVAARSVADGRPWAAVLGTGLAPAMLIATSAFAGWALWHLSFTVFMFATPPAALLATILLPMTIRAALRCREARKMVAEELSGASMFGGVG